MNYDDAIKFIQNRLRLGTKLGLETTTELLRRLGDPHKKLKFIHIAGTNGKGSTSAFITNILMANGYKTGMYISPYIHSFNERIQVNGTKISNRDLATHTEKIKSVIDDTICPTEFEIVTAIGFLHFLEQQCDVVVLEVGLGGRFDATNVINAPAVSVITSLSIDHTDLLGETIEEITFEKCGIIKRGSVVAVYPDNPEAAINVIKNTANSKNVPVTIADKNAVKIISTSIDKTVFSYMGEQYQISMLGVHQVYNAVTAITAAKLFGITSNFAQGLKQTKFSGRFEVVNTDPTIIIDGAHNYSGVFALKNAIDTYFPTKKLILVMGMLRDKEYEKCISIIAPLAHYFVATEPDNPRAVAVQVLMETAGKYTKNLSFKKDRQQALDYAKTIANKDDIICICGSLYLIGGLKY
ncbi:MAG: bifunctional folylpolyglutamate synthase/dihydrofolate synthase [Clostridiaceae bacterium]|jgi:dihydrofolate synthase/folylpolyglutamate synthase|nr:bifunctional folylpolyglutamate synthase/dihydrofolate synthase [Clostridiaceae bacterium]